jgi:hypothetical protein
MALRKGEGQGRKADGGGGGVRKNSLPGRTTTITSENKELRNIQDEFYVSCPHRTPNINHVKL